MYPHVFLLLLSSGVSSYFLPQKEMPRLLNETKYALIDEMLCLLEAENGHMKENFLTPVHVKKQSCAHYNAETFIYELQKIHTLLCMGRVEKDMEELEKICYILKKSPSNDRSCSKKNTKFSEFKESLQEFLRWVNEKLDCKNVGRNESGLYLDSKCSCHDTWKSQRGLG